MSTYLVFQDKTPLLQQGGVTPIGAIELSQDQIESVRTAMAVGKRIIKKGTRFEILDPTADSYWAQLRMRRNQLLMQSDWTQLADAPVDATAWATYRQELRDLPSTTADPTAVTWPTIPA